MRINTLNNNQIKYVLTMIVINIYMFSISSSACDSLDSARWWPAPSMTLELQDTCCRHSANTSVTLLAGEENKISWGHTHTHWQVHYNQIYSNSSILFVIAEMFMLSPVGCESSSRCRAVTRRIITQAGLGLGSSGRDSSAPPPAATTHCDVPLLNHNIR